MAHNGPNTNYRGRGGRIKNECTPQSAAENEHVVVRGSSSGTRSTKIVAKDEDSISPLINSPPILNVPPDEGGYFFDCDTPKDEMDEDTRPANLVGLDAEPCTLNSAFIFTFFYLWIY